MQFLRRMIDKSRKLYHEPGSRFHKVWPLFEAFETFLFVPGTTAPEAGPHVRDYVDLKRVMNTVILALLPGLLFSMWNTGHQHFLGLEAVGRPAAGAIGWFDEFWFGLLKMLPIIVISYGVGLGIEMAFCVWRKEDVSEGYLVTGMLIPLIVPASIPLWQLALAIVFSVVLVKEVFGGTGMNIFNVALMARAFLFFAYPAQISGDAVWVAGTGPTNLVDGLSKATPLAVGAQANIQVAHEGLLAAPPAGVEAIEGALWDAKGNAFFETASDAVHAAGYSWGDMFWGTIPGSAGETSAFCILLGAALLLITGIGSWRTMLAGAIGLFGTAFVMNWVASGLDGIGSLSAMDHLVMGGFLFGIVFMATDPVTCPETNRGKWIYGILIGVMTVLVRAVNPAYPEGTMLAILLLNAFAPTIDHFVVAANIKRRKVRLG